ncbi:MAG: HAMP domain-containing protein [Clostridia bacterium]|nr:HAMP domain-containing protein [Clostridia bacterium]
MKSLYAKLVTILVLLILAVLVVAGTVLISGVSHFFAEDFDRQIHSALDDKVISEMQELLTQPDAASRICDLLTARSGPLGIDSYRNFYILSADGVFLDGSNTELGKTLELTPKLIAVLAGRNGEDVRSSDGIQDYARLLQDENGNSLVLYVQDTGEESGNLIWVIFINIFSSLVIALLIAFLLALVFARTISAPVKRLTRGAHQIAGGDFSEKLQVLSSDEIGELTQTFNHMAGVLQNTLEEVRDERNKLQTMFAYLTDGVAAFLNDGTLLNSNKAAVTMARTEFKDLNGFCDALALNIDREELRHLAEGEHIRCETALDDSAYMVYFASFRPEENDPDSGGVIAVLHDVTEQTRLENARREFVANVSHELRTPLTSIKGATETLLETPDIPPQISHHFLEMVSGEADRMTRIVKDLLVLSRLDNGKMNWQFAPFSLDRSLTRIFESMQMEATAKKQSLSLFLPEKIDMVGDRERIEQVAVNILSNAIKYTPEGGQIRLSGLLENGHAVIVVKDNGIGIAQEDIPRLFERFYRVDKSRASESGGTGLGLAIAQEIVAAHHGDIRVQSELGQGTEIRVYLPLQLPTLL